jgi:hypothetical protein
MNNALLLIDMIFAGLDRIDRLKQLFGTARAEGRDVTDAELDALRAEDDAARDALAQLIASKRAAGG